MRNVFVISLPQDIDRYNDLLEHHRRHAPHLSITKIEGVQGSKLTLKERRIACRSSLHRPWLTDSMLGCGLSHLKALRQFIDQQKDEIALILEDDARISLTKENMKTKWDALAKQMKEKNVDLVHLGGHETEEGYNLLVRGVWKKEQNKDEDEIVPIFWWSTTGSYAVTQRGAKRILEALDGKMNYHVDMVYHGLIRQGVIRGMCVRRPWFLIRSDYTSHNADGQQSAWMTRWIPPDIVHLILTMSILRLPIIGSVTLIMILGGILLSILPLPLMFLLILLVRGRTQGVWAVQFLVILLFPQTRKAWFAAWWMVLLLFAIVFLTTIRPYCPKMQ